jgi:hypothetical protein
MSEFRFDKPVKYGKWNIFKDAVYSNLDVSDCTNSVTGKCEDVKTVEDCADICGKHLNCDSGYFIENTDRNICVPVRKPKTENIYPYYRYRNKSIYPQLKNRQTFTFSSYDYPPSFPNAIFYKDFFSIQIKGDKKYLNIDTENKAEKDIKFLDIPIHVQFLLGKIQRNYIEGDIAIKNGDNVILNIPNTSLVLYREDEKIVWKIGDPNSGDRNMIFQIYSDKKETENITFSDNIILKMDDKYLSPKGDSLVLSENKTFFTLTPKIEVYYCDGTCKSVLLEQCVKKGVKAFFNGKEVYRSPSCWNLCDNLDNNKRHDSILLIILTILLLLFILFYFLTTYIFLKTK